MNNAWQGAGRRIRIQEVGTRDGLQMEAQFVPTADKIALIDALSQTGLAKIEVTSFTSPKAIPALRDAEIVMREIARVPGVVYTALVPNVRGAERAIESRTDELNLVMSTSETHNLANLRMTRERSFAGLTEVVRAARERWPGTELTLHFHNTRGMGLANVLAAIDAGADRFDTSIGGLGGCPYAPGATGNVCSEEIVHALQLMGFDTGVDLGRLIAASKRLPALIGHEVPSQIVKAGQRLDLHPVPDDFDAVRERALARDNALT